MRRPEVRPKDSHTEVANRQIIDEFWNLLGRCGLVGRVSNELNPRTQACANEGVPLNDDVTECVSFRSDVAWANQEATKFSSRLRHYFLPLRSLASAVPISFSGL